jgi:hypothetical protein
VGAVVAVTALGEWVAFRTREGGTAAFWATALGPLAIVAALGVARAARDGDLQTLFRPVWGDATRGIASAGVLFAAALLFTRAVAPMVSSRVAWTARIYLAIGDPRWLQVHAALVGAVIVLAAAAEEVAWRGLVTRLIAERVGSRYAWVWAAVPYAAAQLPTVWALADREAGPNPLIVACALMCGLVWGALTRWTGRLIPAILSHAVFDWCLVMVFPLWGYGA